MSAMPRYPTFFIGIIISCILGAVEGSVLCYIFSGLNQVWLVITSSFGLVLTGSLVWVYYYFKNAEPYASDGVRSASSTRPYRRLPSTALEESRDDASKE